MTTTAFNQLLGSTENIFADMQTAEDIIAEKQKRHPEHADQIWKTFRLLRRTEPLNGKDPLYRIHCREIIHRVTLNPQVISTQLPTRAEIAGFMSDLSLRQPLTHDQDVLYRYVFPMPLPLGSDKPTTLNTVQVDMLDVITAKLTQLDRKEPKGK